MNLKGGSFALSNIYKTKITRQDLYSLIKAIKTLFINENYFSTIDKEILKKYKGLSWLNVSEIKNMGYLFTNFPFNKIIYNKTYTEITGKEDPDIDITGWNVSNVEKMNNMFLNCETLDQDLSRWNVSNVKSMNYMFRNSGYNNYFYNNKNTLAVHTKNVWSEKVDPKILATSGL